MKARNKITILIVDDHPVVRHGYRLLLEGGGDMKVVAEAGNAHDAYGAAVRYLPDVIVMDISLPDNSGLDAIGRILAREPGSRILVFSIHENPLLMTRAKEKGAKGYLTKRSIARQMVEAVRLVAKGGEYYDCGPAASSQAAVDDPLQQLSSREFEVFLLLAKGLSVKRIADILHISRKTVGIHHTRIMNKIGADSPAYLARLAIRHGLIQP
ncbi:MAG: response regulator [Gammaproteobacteria bacterium]